MWYSWVMLRFTRIEEIETWLEPLDYQGFWDAIKPYDFKFSNKEDCDRQIATGAVTEEMVLAILKYYAPQELGQNLIKS